MACCSTGCGSGCGGGNGGGYGGSGSGGVLVDSGTTSSAHVQPGGCTLVVPGPHLICHGDTRVSCHCVCASECCMPCGSSCGGGRGGSGPGLKVDMCYPSYDVVMPAGYLCSTAHCGRVSTSCCDPCSGPC